MKGEWAQEPNTQVWHLIYEHEHWAVGNVSVWCRAVIPGKDLVFKSGGLIDWSDICHDECVRKSETLDGPA